VSSDGSSIKIWLDGVSIAHPAYNIYREDIAALFPGYANSNGAGGYYTFDTSSYENGIHTISWSATDSAGNNDGIGSRYFYIQNFGGTSNAAGNSDNMEIPTTSLNDLAFLPRSSSPVTIMKGCKPDSKEGDVRGYKLYSDKNGITRITIKELERVEIQLGEDLFPAQGYMIINNRLTRLPIATTLDKKTGRFCWWPGPGFCGYIS